MGVATECFFEARAKATRGFDNCAHFGSIGFVTPSESMLKHVPTVVFQRPVLLWFALGIAVLARIYTMWLQTRNCQGPVLFFGGFQTTHNLFRRPRVSQGHWVDISPCSASCGEGVMKIRFNITSLAKNGQACPTFANRPCNQFPCPTNCQLSEWTAEPDGCSTSCGGGVLREVRTIQRAAAHGGRCPDPSSPGRERSTTCNNQPCPVDSVDDDG